jgi:hypothetical protein
MDDALFACLKYARFSEENSSHFHGSGVKVQRWLRNEDGMEKSIIGNNFRFYRCIQENIVQTMGYRLVY